MIGALEPLARLGANAPWLWNLGLSLPGVRHLNRALFGLVDPPKLSPKPALSILKADGAHFADVKTIQSFSDQQRQKAVILVPDTFSALCDASTLVESYRALSHLAST